MTQAERLKYDRKFTYNGGSLGAGAVTLALPMAEPCSPSTNVPFSSRVY